MIVQENEINNIFRLAFVNIRGIMGDGGTDRIENVIKLMNREELDVCGCAETWCRCDDGDDVQMRIGGEWVWKNVARRNLNRNARRASGGVGWMKRTKNEAKTMKRPKSDGVVWTRHEEGNVVVYAAFVYIVPVASSRSAAVPALLLELEADILKYSKLGMVVVMGDFNCRVGEKCSELLEVDEEESDGVRLKRYERKSDDKKRR
jgi:hypothetical protein